MNVSSTSLPFLVGSDFNIVCRSSKMLGGNDIDFTAADEFNRCIDDCGLLEVNFIGSRFTWKKSIRTMWQRLNRIM